MSNQYLITAKELYNALEDVLFDPRAQKAFARVMPDSSITISDLLKHDSMRFMLHIAMTDEEITQREANVINYMTGQMLTVRALRREARKYRRAMSNPILDVPQLVRVVCLVDNTLAQDPTIDYSTSFLNLVVAYFKNLGFGMMDIYPSDAEQELKRISANIQNINKYASCYSRSAFYAE